MKKTSFVLVCLFIFSSLLSCNNTKQANIQTNSSSQSTSSVQITEEEKLAVEGLKQLKTKLNDPNSLEIYSIYYLTDILFEDNTVAQKSIILIDLSSKNEYGGRVRKYYDIFNDSENKLVVGEDVSNLQNLVTNNTTEYDIEKLNLHYFLHLSDKSIRKEISINNVLKLMTA